MATDGMPRAARQRAVAFETVEQAEDGARLARRVVVGPPTKVVVRHRVGVPFMRALAGRLPNVHTAQSPSGPDTQASNRVVLVSFDALHGDANVAVRDVRAHLVDGEVDLGGRRRAQHHHVRHALLVDLRLW